jgi:hypothetical protein
MSVEEHINNFVNMIFSSDPVSSKSFMFEFKGSEEQLNNILINILINGSKKVFGESTYLPNISIDQFELLNKYMQSMGYTAKREFKYQGDQIVDVRVWFEKLN